MGVSQARWIPKEFANAEIPKTVFLNHTQTTVFCSSKSRFSPHKTTIFPRDEATKPHGFFALFPGKPSDLQPSPAASGLAKVPAVAGEAGDEPAGTGSGGVHTHWYTQNF